MDGDAKDASMNSGETPILELPRPTWPVSPRREDVDAKHRKLARLLADADCEALLVLERANFRWLTGGAAERGIYHAEECPALYFNPSLRWVICGSIDTQRLFDEELDGLGFQVKEWPTTIGREQFLTDLCHGRRMAVDRPFRDFKHVGLYLEQERRRLSVHEQEHLRELGGLLAHALEATARNLTRGDREEEIAGHLAHRLLKHGVDPVVLSIAAEDRGRLYRRPGFTGARAETRCQLQATASKFGLFATASRTVCLDAPADAIKHEHETACRVQAAWLATVRAGDRPAALFQSARTLLRETPFEHEDRLSTPGWWTGRQPSETLFLPASPEQFLDGQALVWQARIGGSVVCETCQVGEKRINLIAPVEDWPIRRYVIQGERYDLPDLLIRNPS